MNHDDGRNKNMKEMEQNQNLGTKSRYKIQEEHKIGLCEDKFKHMGKNID